MTLIERLTRIIASCERALAGMARLPAGHAAQADRVEVAAGLRELKTQLDELTTVTKPWSATQHFKAVRAELDAVSAQEEDTVPDGLPFNRGHREETTR